LVIRRLCESERDFIHPEHNVTISCRVSGLRHQISPRAKFGGDRRPRFLSMWRVIERDLFYQKLESARDSRIGGTAVTCMLLPTALVRLAEGAFFECKHRLIC
jgi:hypothetical protein